MDHDQATAMHAPVRYAAGELTAAERDEFEQHFSDCPPCMDEVTAAATFAANARAVFRDRVRQPEPARKARWWDIFRLQPVPVFALSGALNVALLAGLGFQMLRVVPELTTRIERLSAPEAAAVFTVTGARRGSSAVVTAPDGASFVRLTFDLPQHFAQYRYMLEGAGWPKPRTGTVRVEAGAEGIDLTVPVAGLGSGEYQVSLLGSNGAGDQEIGRCTIRVNAK